MGFRLHLVDGRKNSIPDLFTWMVWNVHDVTDVISSCVFERGDIKEIKRELTGEDRRSVTYEFKWGSEVYKLHVMSYPGEHDKTDYVELFYGDEKIGDLQFTYDAEGRLENVYWVAAVQHKKIGGNIAIPERYYDKYYQGIDPSMTIVECCNQFKINCIVIRDAMWLGVDKGLQECRITYDTEGKITEVSYNPYGAIWWIYEFFYDGDVVKEVKVWDPGKARYFGSVMIEYENDLVKRIYWVDGTDSWVDYDPSLPGDETTGPELIDRTGTNMYFLYGMCSLGMKWGDEIVVEYSGDRLTKVTNNIEEFFGNTVSIEPIYTDDQITRIKYKDHDNLIYEAGITYDSEGNVIELKWDVSPRIHKREESV